MKPHLIILALLLSPMIAAAAVNDSEYKLLKPGMGSKWLNEVGVDVTDRGRAT